MTENAQPSERPPTERAAPDGDGSPPVDLTIVTLVFEARTAGSGPGDVADRLLAVLSKYVVLSRTQPGCRNIDLCASVTAPGRYLVVEKWENPVAQRAHFDSPEMVEMARSCEGLLEHRPAIDLFEGISAHDLN